MIRALDLRIFVIRPTLRALGLWSEAAENLLLGTAATESRLGTYLVQMSSSGDGRALGIYQIEQQTHNSIWENYIKFRPGIDVKLKCMVPYARITNDIPDHNQLITNLEYATAIARLVYYPHAEKLPDATDIAGLGIYYKRYYNTIKGRGSVDKFIKDFSDCRCAIDYYINS